MDHERGGSAEILQESGEVIGGEVPGEQGGGDGSAGEALEELPGGQRGGGGDGREPGGFPVPAVLPQVQRENRDEEDGLIRG